MTLGELSAEEKRWIAAGRTDIGMFAFHGLGIKLHDKQIEALEAIDGTDALFYFWWWANRVGKTTGVIVKHLHMIYYKPGLMTPRSTAEQDLWLAEDFRTLHAAPLGGLATKAHSAILEITKGVHPAQRDLDTGERRRPVLGSSFTATTEVDAQGARRMVVKSSNGGTIDFFSTEGGGGRLEGSPWRLIVWDEWPQQEASDKATAIRNVLTRLQNRASDFNAKIVLTGTITPETEHIAKEWIEQCEDPSDLDWTGSSATRMDNPSASTKAVERAERTMDPEDYARTVLGMPGGVKNRLFPSFMVDPIFGNDLPRQSPPHPYDGAVFVPTQAPPMVRSRPRDPDEQEAPRIRGQFKPRNDASPFVHLHIWDLAIAAAANIGHVWRLPADIEFGWVTRDGQRILRAIEGVHRVEIPGSRTLTSAEIIYTIEQTYLMYGGRIVVDSTDAHGKNIERELRRAGYPVEGFVFNERDQRRVIRKDTAIHHTRELLTEGMVFRRDGAGEVIYENDVPVWEPDTPYGVLRLPRDWRKARDQLTILRPDDDKQTKDEAMVVLMGCETAYRMRRSRTRHVESTPFAVFGGGRTLRG